MAYAWGYENYTDPMCQQGQSRRFPETIEHMVFRAVTDLFQNVPALNDVDRAMKVRKAIRTISNTYQTKLNTESRPNWHDPAFRCAYVYLYTLKHSSLVFDILSTLLRDPNIIENWSTYLRVCCAGGGPGSEIIGLMLYLTSMNIFPYIECNVMDLNPSWKNAWETIQQYIPTEPKIDVTYTLFDMADTNSWLWRDVEAAVSGADLVTFVKSLSAVHTFIAEHKIGTGAIPAVLRALKPGAVVLYIDNMRDDANMIFLHMAHDEGLQLIQEMHDESYNKPSEKFLKAMKHFEDMFDYRPLRGCKVSAFVLRKPLCQPNHPTLEWTPSGGVTHKPAPNPDAAWNPDNRSNFLPSTNTNFPSVPKPTYPMLQWSPFGGEVRELRPDPQFRPTFCEYVAEASPGTIGVNSWRGRRKRRRVSPLQRKAGVMPNMAGPHRPVLAGIHRRESVGESTVTSPYPWDMSASFSSFVAPKKFDFTADWS